MSTLVPKQNATLATACVLLVMGGAISEPQVIADATGVAWLLDGISGFPMNYEAFLHMFPRTNP